MALAQTAAGRAMSATNRATSLVSCQTRVEQFAALRRQVE
jgi:hypothetical protein